MAVKSRGILDVEEGSCASAIEKAACIVSSAENVALSGEESQAGSGDMRLIVPSKRDLEVKCTEWKCAGF